MLRKTLESFTGPLSSSEFAEIADLTTADIMVNRIAFQRRTSPKEAVDIALGCFIALQRGCAAQEFERRR